MTPRINNKHDASPRLNKQLLVRYPQENLEGYFVGLGIFFVFVFCWRELFVLRGDGVLLCSQAELKLTIYYLNLSSAEITNMCHCSWFAKYFLHKVLIALVQHCDCGRVFCGSYYQAIVWDPPEPPSLLYCFVKSLCKQLHFDSNNFENGYLGYFLIWGYYKWSCYKHCKHIFIWTFALIYFG